MNIQPTNQSSNNNSNNSSYKEINSISGSKIIGLAKNYLDPEQSKKFTLQQIKSLKEKKFDLNQTLHSNELKKIKNELVLIKKILLEKEVGGEDLFKDIGYLSNDEFQHRIHSAADQTLTIVSERELNEKRQEFREYLTNLMNPPYFGSAFSEFCEKKLQNLDQMNKGELILDFNRIQNYFDPVLKDIAYLQKHSNLSRTDFEEKVSTYFESCSWNDRSIARELRTDQNRVKEMISFIMVMIFIESPLLQIRERDLSFKDYDDAECTNVINEFLHLANLDVSPSTLEKGISFKDVFEKIGVPIRQSLGKELDSIQETMKKRHENYKKFTQFRQEYKEFLMTTSNEKYHFFPPPEILDPFLKKFDDQLLALSTSLELSSERFEKEILIPLKEELDSSMLNDWHGRLIAYASERKMHLQRSELKEYLNEIKNKGFTGKTFQQFCDHKINNTEKMTPSSLNMTLNEIKDHFDPIEADVEYLQKQFSPSTLPLNGLIRLEFESLPWGAELSSDEINSQLDKIKQQIPSMIIALVVEFGLSFLKERFPLQQVYDEQEYISVMYEFLLNAKFPVSHTSSSVKTAFETMGLPARLFLSKELEAIHETVKKRHVNYHKLKTFREEYRQRLIEASKKTYGCAPPKMLLRQFLKEVDQYFHLLTTALELTAEDFEKNILLNIKDDCFVTKMGYWKKQLDADYHSYITKEICNILSKIERDLQRHFLIPNTQVIEKQYPDLKDLLNEFSSKGECDAFKKQYQLMVNKTFLRQKLEKHRLSTKDKEPLQESLLKSLKVGPPSTQELHIVKENIEFLLNDSKLDEFNLEDLKKKIDEAKLSESLVKAGVPENRLATIKRFLKAVKKQTKILVDKAILEFDSQLNADFLQKLPQIKERLLENFILVINHYNKKSLNEILSKIDIYKSVSDLKTLTKLLEDDAENWLEACKNDWSQYITQSSWKRTFDFYKKWSPYILVESIQGHKNASEALGRGVCMAKCYRVACLEQRYPDVSIDELGADQILPEDRYNQAYYSALNNEILLLRLNSQEFLRAQISPKGLIEKSGYEKIEVLCESLSPILDIHELLMHIVIQKRHQMNCSNGVIHVGIAASTWGHAIHLRLDMERNIFRIHDPNLGVLDFSTLQVFSLKKVEKLAECFIDLFKTLYPDTSLMLMYQLL